MLKKIISVGMMLTLFYGSSLCAKTASLPPSGSHFNISATPASTILNITTTTPNKTYPTAGFKILTAGYSISGTPSRNGYYLFSVSDTVPATFTLSGKIGDVTIQLCLNGVGDTYTCEKHTVALTSTHIIFLTSTLYNGNLGGVGGADALCQSVAYQAGSIIPRPDLTFRALLVTPTRYPCDGTGLCGGVHANDWPLTPGQEFLYSNGTTFFNTVNTNGVFDGSNRNITNEQGSGAGPHWSGIQSILSNADAEDIAAWAYADANSGADGAVYNPFSCSGFTSSLLADRGTMGFSGDSTGSTGGVPANTWGNYLFFDDNMDSGLQNLFIATGFNFTCNQLAAIICVS